MKDESCFLTNIQKGIFSNKYESSNSKLFNELSNRSFLELLYIASRWAELEMRGKRNNSQI